jgi:hypothetical protein
MSNAFRLPSLLASIAIRSRAASSRRVSVSRLSALRWLAVGAAAVFTGTLAADAMASIEVDGQTIQVIDMHMHPGIWGDMNPTGKAFIVSSIPQQIAPYAPALFGNALDPYAPFMGIGAECEAAGVDKAVLYAVYSHHSTGYYTNESLAAALEDPRNDGWALGFASINFDDLDDPVLVESRLAAMASYIEARPDLFVGIKLAHTHQGVSFDDVGAFGVYEVAADLGVPVLLHTGFSPFPGTIDEPEYYDPAFVEDILQTYSGDGGGPRVEFVFSHVGQGDARSVASALDLAEQYDNVWLEISALARPTLIDENGQPVEDGELQYPGVLAEIKARGLVNRTLYASDGPQLTGNTKAYLDRMVMGMKEAAYTTAEIERVLSGSFEELYLDGASAP